jgi:hypothetical protein
MEPVYARSLKRRRPGQGGCNCCFMFGLGLLSVPLAVGLALTRVVRARRAQ